MASSTTTEPLRVSDLIHRLVHHAVESSSTKPPHRHIPSTVSCFTVPKRLRGADPKALLAAALVEVIQSFVDVLPELRQSAELGNDLYVLRKKQMDVVASLKTALSSMGNDDSNSEQRKHCADALAEAEKAFNAVNSQYKDVGDAGINLLQKLAQDVFLDFLPVIVNIIQAFDMSAILEEEEEHKADTEAKEEEYTNFKAASPPRKDSNTSKPEPQPNLRRTNSEESKEAKKPTSPEAKQKIRRENSGESKSQGTGTQSRPEPTTPTSRTSPTRQSAEQSRREEVKRRPPQPESRTRPVPTEEPKFQPKSRPESKRTPSSDMKSEPKLSSRTSAESRPQPARASASTSTPRNGEKKAAGSSSTPRNGDVKPSRPAAQADSQAAKPRQSKPKAKPQEDLFDFIFDNPEPNGKSAKPSAPKPKTNFDAFFKSDDFDVPLTGSMPEGDIDDFFSEKSTGSSSRAPEGFSFAAAQSGASAEKVSQAAKQRVEKYRQELEDASDKEKLRDAIKRSLSNKFQAWEFERFGRRKHVAVLLADLKQVIWKESSLYTNPIDTSTLGNPRGIKIGVRKVQAECHPDRQVGNDMERQIVAHLIFQGVTAAWEEFQARGQQ